MNGVDDYITDDPQLADYAILGYKVDKDESAPDLPENWIENLLLTKEMNFSGSEALTSICRDLYTNIDIAFTELDRKTNYGEPENDNLLFLLYQAYNTDRPKLIRFWKYDTLYLNGVDYTLDPYGNPIARTY